MKRRAWLRGLIVATALAIAIVILAGVMLFSTLESPRRVYRAVFELGPRWPWFVLAAAFLFWVWCFSYPKSE